MGAVNQLIPPVKGHRPLAVGGVVRHRLLPGPVLPVHVFAVLMGVVVLVAVALAGIPPAFREDVIPEMGRAVGQHRPERPAELGVVRLTPAKSIAVA